MRMTERLECYIDGYSIVNIYMIKDFYQGQSQTFHLKDEQGELVPLNILSKEDLGDYMHYTCAVDGEIEVGRDYLMYEEHAQYCPAKYSHIVKTQEFANRYVSLDEDCGCRYTPEKTEFTVWSPVAVWMEIVLHEEQGDRIIPMHRNEKGVWKADVEGDLLHTFYNYRFKVNGTIGESIDPWNPFTGINTSVSQVNSMDRLKKSKDLRRADPLPAMKQDTDAIIYETSIRDMSAQKNSGFTHPRTFEAFTEENDCTRAQKTGLSYLKTLGVSHIQIMPVFDFGSVDEEYPTLYYNWGYDPMSYRAFEGSYSTDPFNPETRILEFMNMVQDLHAAGLKVNLDLVFNHVWKREQFALDQLMPDYYFLMDSQGNYSNGSFCGNDIDTRPAMSRKYLLDSAKMMIDLYDVDGFRFDLMGVLDYSLVNAIAEYAKSKKPDFMIYGEGWDMPSFVPSELRASQNNQGKMPLVGQFSDRFREVIRGSNDQLEQAGYSNGNTGRIEDARMVMAASIFENRYDQPFKAVNYVECHDNHTMWDKNRAVCFGQPRSIRMKRQTLATAMVLLAQGTPFIHCGQEFGRTKQNLGNTYNRSDNYNMIDYHRRDELELLVRQFQDLVALRKEHPSFRLNTAQKIRENVQTETIDGKVLVYKTAGEGEQLISFFNPTGETFGYTLPKEGKILFDSENRNAEQTTVVQIGPISTVVVELEPKRVEEPVEENSVEPVSESDETAADQA